MNDIIPIVATSIRNNLRLKAATITFISIVLICVIGLALLFCLLFIAPAMKKELPDRSEMELYLGLILFITCFIGVGVNLNAFAFPSMTREKSRGIIESLLATPVKVIDIWMAKSLAVFLPGLIVGWVITLIALVVINYIYFIPALGFLVTPWMVISSFIAIPLVYFCLTLLVHLIGLVGKPATGNVVAQVFLPVMIALLTNLVVRNIMDVSSWIFTLVNIGIAVVIGIVVVILLNCLTRERIVLSLRS